MSSAMATSGRGVEPNPPQPPPRRRHRRTSPSRVPPRHTPWWGDGEPPTDRWPGVTIDFKAQWSPERDRWETHQGRFYFDTKEADHVAKFFPLFLRHHMGEFAGTAFELRDDQAQLLVRPLFGWKRTNDGLRRFRKMFAFCPKGYGKSPVGAGLAIYLARCDGESAAEVYAVAADRENAKIVHDNAKIMVEHSPSLASGSEILRDSIVWAGIHSSLKVLSSDASTKHGFRPHGVIFDELHAQKNRDLYEALKKSMVKRRQPLMIIITHAGTDDEGICYEEYDLARRVLSGSTDIETTLPVIFEIAKGESWTDPAIWQRVNPGHGHTVKHDAIVDECHEALAEPRKRNDFVRYHLNQWTNQATAWIPIEWWDACTATSTLTPTVDETELLTLQCAAGLDLAQKWDLACFCVCFRKYLDRTAVPPVDVVVTDEQSDAIAKKSISLNYLLIVRPYFWIPEETMWQHEKEDGIPYHHWAELGLVTPTEGITIDYTRIYHDITTKILPRYPKLKQGLIGYDPAFATDIATKLRDLAGLQILEVLQNYKMLSEPSQIVEALLKGKRVRHDGHRTMRSHWENATIKTDDAGRIRPVKPKNATKRIDGVVAMIMGEKVLSLQPRPPEYQMFFLGAR
jgi:phage terminase large subunit-like protein